MKTTLILALLLTAWLRLGRDPIDVRCGNPECPSLAEFSGENEAETPTALSARGWQVSQGKWFCDQDCRRANWRQIKP